MYLFHYSYYQEVALLIYNLSLGEKSTVTILQSIGMVFSAANNASAMGVFICLTWMTSMILQALARDIKLRTAELPSHSDILMKTQLLKWRRHYGLICELVDQINHCFGLILLIFVAKQFIVCITYSFSILLDLQKDIISPQTMYLFQFLIFYLSYITLTTTICHNIRKQVE